MELFGQRKKISGSILGSFENQVKLLELAAEKGIKPQVEVVKADQLDQVLANLRDGNKAGKKYVLDVAQS